MPRFTSSMTTVQRSEDQLGGQERLEREGLRSPPWTRRLRSRDSSAGLGGRASQQSGCMHPAEGARAAHRPIDDLGAAHRAPAGGRPRWGRRRTWCRCPPPPPPGPPSARAWPAPAARSGRRARLERLIASSPPGGLAQQEHASFPLALFAVGALSRGDRARVAGLLQQRSAARRRPHEPDEVAVDDQRLADEEPTP